jgi:hypothetical protein
MGRPVVSVLLRVTPDLKFSCSALGHTKTRHFRVGEAVTMDAASQNVTRADLVELYRERTGLVVDVRVTKVWSDRLQLVIPVSEKNGTQSA